MLPVADAVPTQSTDRQTAEPPQSLGRDWQTRSYIAGTFALCTAIFGYGFATFLSLQHSSDMSEHIYYAERIRSLSDLASPHFLFQLLLKAAVFLAPLTYISATAWILGLCYGGMAALIAGEILRRGAPLTATRAFVLVPAVLIASHVFLLTAFPPTLYRGYFVPTAYHNPTQQLNKLFTLWIYFLYCAQFLDSRRARVLPTLSAGGLGVLSAVAKPSFLVAFLPTASLFALADLFRRRWRQVLLFGFGIAVPITLVLLWQAVFTYGQNSGSGLVFAPFVVFDFNETLYKLPASLAFPIVVAAVALHGHVRDAKFVFAWVFTAIAMFMTLFLGERARMMDGNFAWTGQTAVFLVYVESVLLLVSRPDLLRWRNAAWAAFAVHVLCGIVWYGIIFSTDWVQWL
jgi:hypothetical protein